MTPTVRGVHLVGSIPLSNTEEVLRAVCQTLPNQLRRIPDGETGERWCFALWQAPKICRWPIILNPLIRKMRKCPEPDPPAFTEPEKEQMLEEIEAELDVAYDIVALESYEVFKKLREEGLLPKSARFLVALPSPLTVTALYARKDFQVEFEELYEAAMMRALEKIQDRISSEELSIQWDCPFELGMMDRAEFPDRDTDPWWEGTMLEGAVSRLARLCGSVKEGAEVGMHLCYGELKICTDWCLKQLTPDQAICKESISLTLRIPDR